MEEKRRASRTELSSELLVKRLDGGGEPIPVGIEIIDVSKSGVGFRCSEKLEIGNVYEGKLTIWTKEVLHCFMEIVRIVKNDKGSFDYGAIFIGMPEMEQKRIEIYQTVSENVK